MRVEQPLPIPHHASNVLRWAYSAGRVAHDPTAHVSGYRRKYAPVPWSRAISEWRRWLVAGKASDATVRQRVKAAERMARELPVSSPWDVTAGDLAGTAGGPPMAAGDGPERPADGAFVLRVGGQGRLSGGVAGGRVATDPASVTLPAGCTDPGALGLGSA